MSQKRKANEEGTGEDASKSLAKSIKKQLKKSADGSCGIKELRKELGSDLSKGDFKTAVKAAAKASEGAFVVDGKTVKAAAGGGDAVAASETAAPKTKKAKAVTTKPSAPSPSAAPAVAQQDISTADLAAVQAWRDEKNVQASEEILPTLSFSDPRLPQNVVQASCKGFTAPTPIQAQCWPILLAGRDMIGLAETGSGKTLAFALPGLHGILTRWGKAPPKRQSPMMLVVAPTRELALQTCAVCEAAAKGVGVKVVCLYGGMPKHEQKAVINGGVAVVIATPGRLRDLSEEGSVDLSQVNYIVLDEADRMLDMGFLPDMRAIISACAPHEQRQTAMLSATWPMAIQKLAVEFLKEPLKVTVGSAHNEATANVRIAQIVEVVEERSRDAKLIALLQKHHSSRKNRVLVFGLYKKECARMERMLQQSGWACCAVHGDKGQKDREEAVNAFKAGTAPLLIATDVAARGLDIPDVEVVINYSFPLTIEDYVHRIGRTGRAGKTGIAHTFFHVGDKAHAGELVNVLNGADQPVPAALMAFGTHTKKKVDKTYGAFFKDVDMSKKATKTTFGSDSDDE
mmetsp:Transcript_16794/g.34211  ORF Transcript_16794/g.34211 Transcript_16794/m.34211 type:complete len:572 (+) Transcript_16794:69-1784(+)|eukprot:CAMPEP_0171718090 /NCGR_PEP_ID=MMETSP0991-20121206/20410_1 /TAXON_ID=483369 /ORGANISM="non described non described, Strain CCMP2098" /LENGTH=571 /DNA_ID=CAMNT_0012309409 /DNA_START=68 /DNA_END=1783 /DNA_ORIENTATION=-